MKPEVMKFTKPVACAHGRPRPAPRLTKKSTVSFGRGFSNTRARNRPGSCHRFTSASGWPTASRRTTGCWPMRCLKTACSRPKADTTGRNGRNSGARCWMCCRCLPASVLALHLAVYQPSLSGQRRHRPSGLDVESVALARFFQPRLQPHGSGHGDHRAVVGAQMKLRIVHPYAAFRASRIQLLS